MKVRYTHPALGELSEILDYIAARSPRGASRVQARIATLLDLLASQPLMGVRTDDPTIRRLVAAPYPYLIFYEASEAEVVVHSIRHAARSDATN